ncbi:MAG: energy transducer TonB [Bacteroidales bacterium]|jgi:protein TonB|nr:energy transducer TonB [Bacteroidales bacterium]
MEQKKSDKANLENKRTLFLEIGFVLALALVFFAFEYKSYDKVEYTNLERTVDDTQEEIIPITEQKVKPPPPKPPPQVTIINVVEDDVEVEDDIEINIDFDEDDAMVEFQFVEEEEEIEEQHIFLVVENMPEFPGGEAAMYKFIGNNIDYPRMAKESGISGRVFVTFVVERDGSVTDVQILRGIGGGCDEEAVRVIKMMPKWTPGKQRGKPVRVQYRMPIKFTLQ